MTVEIDQPAIEHRHDFINRIRKQKAAIEDRYLGFGFGNIVAVEINRAHSYQSPTLSPRTCFRVLFAFNPRSMRKDRR